MYKRWLRVLSIIAIGKVESIHSDNQQVLSVVNGACQILKSGHRQCAPNDLSIQLSANESQIKNFGERTNLIHAY